MTIARNPNPYPSTAALERRIAELESENAYLKQLVCTDSLTDLLNRREFDRLLDEEWRRLYRDRKPLALIFVDVDNLKLWNSKHGHLSGSEMLRRVGKVLAAHARRASDRAFRFGGDEFALMLPGTSLEQAMKIAQSIRLQVEATGNTVSQGVAAVIPNGDRTWKDLVEAANWQMFQAKESGRNCVKAEKLDRSS